MSLARTRWKFYLRLALVGGVAVAVGLVLVMNRKHSTPVWFFGFTDSTKPMNVTWLMLCTAVASLLSWWTFSFSRGLWRDAQELRRQSNQDRGTVGAIKNETTSAPNSASTKT